MLNIADALCAALDKQTERLLVDLLAIPEAAGRVSPGGTARSPYAVAVECAVVNTRIAESLAGRPVPPLPTPAEYDELLAHLPTYDLVAEFVLHETLVLKYAANNTDPATWDDMITLSPTRPPMTRFAAILLAINHLSYHDGQLNLIQSLHGDEARHW